jgi:hypothetical protein
VKERRPAPALPCSALLALSGTRHSGAPTRPPFLAIPPLSTSTPQTSELQSTDATDCHSYSTTGATEGPQPPPPAHLQAVRAALTTSDGERPRWDGGISQLTVHWPRDRAASIGRPRRPELCRLGTVLSHLGVALSRVKPKLSWSVWRSYRQLPINSTPVASQSFAQKSKKLPPSFTRPQHSECPISTYQMLLSSASPLSAGRP